MALGTSWSTLAVQSFNFSYGGYSFTFEQAVDGYYEKLNSTTARVHLRGWIKNASSWGWTGTNKTWGIWCTNGASYDTGGRTDSATMSAGVGHHLPDSNGVYFDIAAGSSFTVNMNYKIPIAGYDHTISAATSVPAFATAPSGLSVSVTGRTYNSFSMSGSISSWGVHTGANQAFVFGVFPSSVTSWTGGRKEWQNLNPGETKSYSGTVSNSSVALDGGVTIKGCGLYKVGLYVRNGSSLDNSLVLSTAYYTPPAPPTISVTDAGYTFTQRKVTITCTGANTTYNYNNNVIFYYRYKKSTDSTYSAWTSMGTGAVTGSKSVTLTLPGSTTYNFQVLQQYQSQNSETKTATYTTLAVPDQGILYAPVNGTSKRVRKLYGSVNGESKEIVKLYGSVNGKSKRIY